MICIAAFAPSLVGCGRKAPGPEECHALAVRWVESTGWPAVRRRAALDEDVLEEAVLKRTTQCLTTPYDRALVACVEARGGVAPCFEAFESRHGTVVVPPE